MDDLGDQFASLSLPTNYGDEGDMFGSGAAAQNDFVPWAPRSRERGRGRGRGRGNTRREHWSEGRGVWDPRRTTTRRRVFEGMTGDHCRIIFDDYNGKLNPGQDGLNVKSPRLLTDSTVHGRAADRQKFITLFVDGNRKVRDRYQEADHGVMRATVRFGHMYFVFPDGSQRETMTVAQFDQAQDGKPVYRSSFYPGEATAVPGEAQGLTLVCSEEDYEVTFSGLYNKILLDGNLLPMEMRCDSFKWLLIDVRRIKGADMRFKLQTEKTVAKEWDLVGRTRSSVNGDILCREEGELKINPTTNKQVTFVRHKITKTYTQRLESYPGLSKVTFYVRSLTEYSRPDGRVFTSVLPARDEVTAQFEYSDWFMDGAPALEEIAGSVFDFGLQLGNDYYQ